MNGKAGAKKTDGRLNSLQAGRALAALAVVIHHSSLATKAFATALPGDRALEAGYLGVDFFFVLSGFIIFHSTLDRDKSPVEYAFARFRRVYPPYFPVGIGIALLYTLAPGLSAGDHQWSWLPTLTLLPVSSESALTVAWTLKHEILFYTLFGALYFTGQLTFGLVAWAVAIIVSSVTGIPGGVPLSLMNLEFLMGIVVASLAHRGHGHPFLYAVALLPLLLWIGLGALRSQSILIGLSFALIILPTVNFERQGSLTIPAWLVFLGTASYSTYLVHGVMVSLASRVVAGQAPWLVFGFCIFGSVVGGILYYWSVERPSLQWSPVWLKKV